MRRLLAVALLASGALLGDGLTYRFRTEVRGVLPSTRSGTAWIDGTRARVELTSGESRTACLRDPSAKDPCRNLDLERKTYYAVACGAAVSMAEASTTALRGVAAKGMASPKRDRLRIEESDLGLGEEIAGLPTRRFVLTVSWRESLRIGPDDVRADLTRKIVVWASDRVAQEAFRFGHMEELLVVPEEARGSLAGRLSSVGFPLKFVVVSTRKFDRGEPTSETLTTVLEDVRTWRPDSTFFDVPPGFRYEEPRISAPAR